MRKVTLTIGVLLLLWGLLPLHGSAYATTASFTFEFQDGVLPPPKPGGSIVIRLFAMAETEAVESPYKKTFLFGQGGATEEAVRDKVFADMHAKAWGVTKIGSNGILITGRTTSAGFLPIREVGADDNHENITVVLQGNVDINDVVSDRKIWKFTPLRLTADAVNPGILALTFNTTAATIEVTTPLSPFDTGEEAAVKLENALTSVGFEVVRVTSQVTLDWEDPVNLGLLGETVDVVFELRGGTWPSLILVLPGADGPSNPPPPPPNPRP